MLTISLPISVSSNVALNQDGVTLLRSLNLVQGNIYDVSLSFLQSGTPFIPAIGDFAFYLRQAGSTSNLISVSSVTSGVSGYSFNLDTTSPIVSAALGTANAIHLRGLLSWVDGSDIEVIEPFGVALYNSFSGLAGVSSYISSLNSLSGDVTLSGSGSISVSQRGQSIVFSSPTVDLSPYYLASNPNGFINSIPSDVVRTTGNQQITGQKSFNSPTVFLSKENSDHPTIPPIYFNGLSETVFMQLRDSAIEFGVSGNNAGMRLDTNPAGYSAIAGATLYGPSIYAAPNVGTMNFLWGGYEGAGPIYIQQGIRAVAGVGGYVGLFSTSGTVGAFDSLSINPIGGNLNGAWIADNMSGKFYGDGSALTGIAGGSSVPQGFSFVFNDGTLAPGQFVANNAFSNSAAAFTFQGNDALGVTLNNSLFNYPADSYLYIQGPDASAVYQITSSSIEIETLGVTCVANNGFSFVNGDTYTFTIIPANIGTLVNGLVKSDGVGNLSAASSTTDYQANIQSQLGSSVAGILKIDGAGSFATAVAGTDYLPQTNPVSTQLQKANNAGGLTDATPGTDYYSPSFGPPAPPLGNVLSASSITPIADGTYTISNSLGGSVAIQEGIITAWNPAS